MFRSCFLFQLQAFRTKQVIAVATVSATCLLEVTFIS